MELINIKRVVKISTCCGGGLADGTDPHPEEAEGARGDKDPTRSAEVVDREDEPPPAPATPDGRVADDVTDGGLCCWDDTEKKNPKL